MSRIGVGTCFFLFALAFACFRTDTGSAGAQAPKPSAVGDARIVPLFNSDTKLEPATIEDTPTALITRVGDRGRDRHAREWMFQSTTTTSPITSSIAPS